MKKIFTCLALLGNLFTTTLPTLYAHEVYVLDKETIARDISNVSPNPLLDIVVETKQFALWGFISIVIVISVLLISITKKVEKWADPFLIKLKKWAPLIARVTLGVCLISSARNGGLFGPELPLTEFAGTHMHFLQLVLHIIGMLLIFGIATRTAASVGIFIFSLAIIKYGTYMITYANYLGELLISLILGGGTYTLSSFFITKKKKVTSFFDRYEKYSFLILRILFGFAIVFASFYAKFLHSNLALDTVIQYHLTNYFHFTPIFIVLGAFIVEMIVGIFFIIGFEVRFTALVFLTFIGLSLLYFGEAVWPHLVLFGINLAILFHGYDDYTIENKLFGRKKLEPVL